MKYRAIVLLLTVFTGLSVFAQSIQEGKAHFYAQRYQLANTVFQQLLKTNPADVEALYWGGQSALYLELDSARKLALVRAWYDKAVQVNSTAPLLQIGAGLADLFENKINEARQKFESALTMTRTKKGDNPDVLAAVIRANTVAPFNELGYFIEKATAQFANEKAEKTAELYLVVGDAIRKAKPGEGGGEAFRNYQEALKLNPSYALASYRLARLFDSQKNWEMVSQYLNECVQKDPTFTPAYYELFYYFFYRRDYVTAEQQLQKYISTKAPEKDIQDEFLYSQLCWARGDYACAITKAEAVLTALGQNTKPRVFRLLADANYQAGDTLQKQGNGEGAKVFFDNAKKYSDGFFAKTGDENDAIILYDFQLRADILDKTGGTPEEISTTYLQSTRIDTLVNLKVELLKKGADRFKAKGDSLSRVLEGVIRTAVIKVKPTPSQRDYFDAGFAFYQGKDYTHADSLFTIYVTKYPDESYGYMMLYNIQRAVDTAMEKGTAVPWAIKYLEILEKDTVKNKKTIIGVAGYLAAYSANILKDKEKALQYLRRMLSLDPTNAAIQQNISTLEKAPANKPEAPKTEGAPSNQPSKPSGSPGNR
jgi:tetratricopeptide (TPR) repeat protein